ncbi:hypothetical protein [Ferruginibacter sp.]
MKYIRPFFILMLLIYSGCDSFYAEEKTVVGNIILINDHVQKDNGFRLNHYTGSFNDNLIQDYVVSLYGNDTVLFVKTRDTITGHRYFEVKHNKGNEPIRVKELDSAAVIYNSYSRQIDHKYSFEEKK